MNDNEITEFKNPFELKEIIQVARKRKFIIIFIFFLTFTSTSIYYYYSKAVYVSSFIVYCRILAPSQTQTLISYLQSQIDINNTDDLIKELNLEQNESEKNFSLAGISSNFKSEDKTIEIKILTYSPDFIPVVKKGVLYYLNNNPFVAKRVLLEKNKTTKLIETIKNQNAELDDVNKQLISILKDQNMSKNVILFPQGEISSTIVSLKSQELSAVNELELTDAFQILTEPIIPITPNRSGLFKKLMIINLASLVAGLFVAIFLENKKHLFS